MELQIFKHKMPKSGYVYKTSNGDVLLQRATKDYDYYSPSHWYGWILGTLEECEQNIKEVQDSAVIWLDRVINDPSFFGKDWDEEIEKAKEYIEWTKSIELIKIQIK